MNSKHKVTQWNRILKLVEKEVPRHLSEMYRSNLMPMTATIVYENMQEDFREKEMERYHPHYQSSKSFFANLALLSRSHWCAIIDLNWTVVFANYSTIHIIRLKRIILFFRIIKFSFYFARIREFLYIHGCDVFAKIEDSHVVSIDCILRVRLCIFFYDCLIIFSIFSCALNLSLSCTSSRFANKSL